MEAGPTHFPVFVMSVALSFGMPDSVARLCSLAPDVIPRISDALPQPTDRPRPVMTLKPQTLTLWPDRVKPAPPHKRVHGGGARFRMFVPLVQDGRTMYPGYAAVEYVQVRCRSRHAHLDP